MKKILLAALAAVLSLTALTSLSAQEKTWSANGYNLKWTVEADRLVMTVSAKTTGWIAVGFEPTSVMKNANIIMLAVDASGATVAEDHFGVTAFTHKKDTDLGGAENVTVISGTEASGTTTVTFAIPLASGDTRDKALASGQTIKIILASSSKDDFGVKHNKKAKGELTL